MKNLIFEFDSKKDWLSMSFLSFLILAFLYAFFGGKGVNLSIELGFADLKSTIISLLVIYFIFLSLKQIIWVINGKLILEFDKNSLTVITKYSFINLKKSYELNRISDLEIRENIDSGTSWIFDGIKVVDRDKSILFFTYNEKEHKLGTKINQFNPDKIKEEITLRTTPLIKNC